MFYRLITILIICSVGFLFTTSQVFAKDWKVKSFTPGECFDITLKGKKDCSGDFTVIWYSYGEGYILEDRYSMLKGKTHSISGCYDPSRAKLVTPAMLKFGIINDPAGKHGYIIIDKKKVKYWSW